MRGDELVPEEVADERGEGVAGDLFAGAVETDDAAGGIEDGDEGADGVEDGGDEVALDGEGLLDAGADAGIALHEADAGVELEAVDDLFGEGGERAFLFLGKGVGGRILHEETADGDAGGGDERGAGVEAEGAAGDHDAVGTVVGVVTGVGDFEHFGLAEGKLAGHAAARKAGGAGADARLDFEAVWQDERNALGHGGIADFGGEGGDFEDGWIGRGAAELVFLKSDVTAPLLNPGPGWAYSTLW